MSSAYRLCAEVIAACRSVTQPGPRRAVLEIFGSRTLHRTGTEAPLTDRRGPVPEAYRDVFCTPLAPAGGLLPINGVMASNLLTPDKSTLGDYSGPIQTWLRATVVVACACHSEYGPKPSVNGKREG